MRRTFLLLSPLVLLAFTRDARAFAGPESVAVLANADVSESAALADAYAAFRSVPARQVCKISGVPQTDDVSLADYQTKILAPFQACLQSGGVQDRIEAVVVMRGVPLRVVVPISSGTTNISLAATLALGQSTLDVDGGATPLLGQEPGQVVNCGSPCYGAYWINPLETLNGPFSAGFSVTRNGVLWKPLIVTMLHGRSQADAQQLITSATQAEQQGGAKGRFMFMDGADSARGVLDTEYPTVISQLKGLGFTDAVEVPYNSDYTPYTLAAFFTGTASIGTTIEGNTYLPGSLVDNLTSFGAVPQNFMPTGETQVSISRWVEKGVGGVHGTVDEPLNNCFPDRTLIVDYVKGAPLGEAYFRHLPYQYWKNLVLGDPMLAPYAKRPTVTITGLSDGANAPNATMVTATATDASGAGIAKTQIYVDGVLAAEAPSDTVSTCVKLPASSVQVLAVAQTNTGSGGLAKFPPKGWTSIHATGAAGGTTTCASDDGGVDGAIGDDAGTGGGGGGGCSCDSTRAPTASTWWLAIAAIVVRRRRQKKTNQ